MLQALRYVQPPHKRCSGSGSVQSQLQGTKATDDNIATRLWPERQILLYSHRITNNPYSQGVANRENESVRLKNVSSTVTLSSNQIWDTLEVIIALPTKK